jgi:hypothetical protein
MIALSTLTADAAQWNGFDRRDFVLKHTGQAKPQGKAD